MTSLRSRPLPGVQSQAEGLSPLCVLSHSVVSNSLCPTKLLCPWNSPGNNTAVGGHFLLQGIFLMQGSNVHLGLAVRIFTTEPPWKSKKGSESGWPACMGRPNSSASIQPGGHSLHFHRHDWRELLPQRNIWFYFLLKPSLCCLVLATVDTVCISTDMTGMSHSTKKYLILLSAKAKSMLFSISNNGIIWPHLFATPISSLTWENTAREKGWRGRGGETLLAPQMHQLYNLVTGVIKLLKKQLITNCYY